MSTTPNRHAPSDEPPTAEEMLAWSRGELAPAEAARIRERLERYPDLARAYSEPFPETGAEPGDPHYVAPDEIEARWNVFRRTIDDDRGRVARFPRILNAVAAALILLLGGLLWQSQRNVRRLETELATPRTLQEYVLPTDGYRGPGARGPTVDGGTDVKLVFTFRGARHYPVYKAEIVEAAASSERPLWSRSGLVRDHDDDFEIVVLRGFLAPGQYRVKLYGLDGRRADRLATYTFRVE